MRKAEQHCHSAQRNIFPAQTWLSLVELLASRARLRFTKRNSFYPTPSWKQDCPVIFVVDLEVKL
jgi:hypothetical protein